MYDCVGPLVSFKKPRYSVGEGENAMPELVVSVVPMIPFNLEVEDTNGNLFSATHGKLCNGCNIGTSDMYTLCLRANLM